ncbi:Gldg family protein [Flavitalea flava]
MRTLLKIARLELSILFFSPIAWLVLIIFIFQNGIDFASNVERWVSSQHMGANVDELTIRLFSFPHGLWPLVQSKLYLYVPLLTMGLMSREISSGSIKLLLSSPARIVEIITGKYLASMLYGLLLMLVLFVFAMAATYSVRGLDLKMVLSGIVGMYLLYCAYAAIGLFMSSLTSYQVVAAISTLFILGILQYVGNLWQDIDFVRDLTNFLSISGRSAEMIEGMITSKDIIYFVVVIILFLGLCMLKLQSGRESGSVLLTVARYSSLLAIVLVIGYVSARPSMIGYLDMTRMKRQTLTPNSQAIVRQIKEPVTMTAYVNLVDNFAYYGLPEMRLRDQQHFDLYTRYLPDMKQQYVYYYDTVEDKNVFDPSENISVRDVAKRKAEAYRIDFGRFMAPAQIRGMIDLAPEEHRFTRLLKLGKRSSYLRMFNDPTQYPSETETSAALKRLLVPAPKVGFVTGDNERDIDRDADKDYKGLTQSLTFRYSLINQGFNFTKVDLERQIPSDIDVLVVADPRTALSAVALMRVQQYITRGGNLLVAGEPGKSAILNPIVSSLGVSFADGVLIEESKKFAPDFLMAEFATRATEISASFGRFTEKQPIVVMQGATGLQYKGQEGLNVIPILTAPMKNTWLKKQLLNADSGLVQYSAERGDRRIQLPTALALTRHAGGKEQRIVVIGDADFMSNSEIGRYNVNTQNFIFSTQVFRWLSMGAFPIDTYRPSTGDDKMRIEQGGVNIIRIAFLGILPGLLLIGGTVFLVRRKRN